VNPVYKKYRRVFEEQIIESMMAELDQLDETQLRAIFESEVVNGDAIINSADALISATVIGIAGIILQEKFKYPPPPGFPAFLQEVQP